MQLAERAPMMLGVLWTFQFIAFGLVGLRLYARLKVIQTYGWDDYFYCTSVAFLFMYTAILTAAATFGLGQEQPDTLDHQSRALLYTNIAQSVMNMALITVKLSIATFLLRLVSSDRVKKILIVVPSVILTVILLAALVVLWLSCTPIAYTWDYTIKDGNCNPQLQFITVLIAGLAVPLMEIYYASFSWYLIIGLQMPKREKIVIGSCMSIGYFSAFCSVRRLIALIAMIYAGSDDSYLYLVVDDLIWQAADVTTQLVCITVTVCRPLYKDWLNNIVEGATSCLSTKKSSKDARSGVGTGSNFVMIALQTIGGSSVPSKGNSSSSKVTTSQFEDPQVVKIERSWKVESKSKSVLFANDSDSEELILGGIGSAKVDPPLERQR